MKEILKWLAAAGLGALAVGLGAIVPGLDPIPSGVDPLIAGVVIAGLKRLVDYLVSKLPVRA